jgi:hypothetical protein
MSITRATSSVLATDAALNNLNAGASITFTKPLTTANFTIGIGATTTFNSTSYSYGTGAAAAHRTALGLGSAATTESNSYATSSHSHGNITNAGAIGSTADLVVTTTTGGVLTTLSRNSIDSRSSFPNADVAAANTGASPNTLVRRDSNGGASFTSVNSDNFFANEGNFYFNREVMNGNDIEIASILLTCDIPPNNEMITITFPAVSGNVALTSNVAQALDSSKKFAVAMAIALG